MAAGKAAVILIVLLGNLMFLADAQLKAFSELQQTDKDISSSFIPLLQVIKQQKVMELDEFQKGILNKIVLEGSLAQGSTAGKVFKPIKSNDGLNKELSGAFTYEILEIPENYKHLLEDIPEREGYVKVRCDMDMLFFLSKLDFGKSNMNVDPTKYMDLLPEILKDGYLKPYRMKEKVIEELEKNADAFKGYDGIMELFLSAVLGDGIDSIQLKTPLKEQSTKFSTSSYVDIMVKDQLKLKYSWDLGIIVKLNWWPQVAQEWVNRKREWPSKEVVNTMSHSYLRMKPVDEENLDKDSVELAYSFSHVEKTLVEKRTGQQNLVYLIFKSMMYRWMKPIVSDRVHSQIGETVMFWTCEEYPPDHKIWDDANKVLTVMFEKVLKAVESKHLPDYFVIKKNIIPNIDKEVQDREAGQIKRIMNDMEKYIPSNVKEVNEACQDMVKTIQSAHKILKELANENYDVFLTRPDLIPKALQIFGLNFLSMGMGKDKKEDLHKTVGDVKDTLTDTWNQFQEDMNMEDVKKTVKEKFDQVTENLDLEDLEKKAKEWLQKWEL